MSSGVSLSDSVSPVSARVSLATATMSPAIAGVDRALHLAQRAGQRPDPLVEVVVLVPAIAAEVPGDVDDRVRREPSGEDADQRQPPDVGIGGGLDDLGAQGARRVAGERAAGLAVGGGDRGQRVLQRRREAAAHQVEDLGRAEATELHGGGDHRVERAAGDGHLQVGDQGVVVDVLAGEVAVHEGLVLALGDDPLDEPGAGVLDQLEVRGLRLAIHPGAAGVVVDPLGDQVDEAGRCSVVGHHRQHQGHDALAEHPLADRHELVEVGPRVVQAGHDDGAGHPDGGALLPEHLRAAVDAVDGRDHEQGGVGRAQPGAQVAHEVGVARRVQEVDLHPVDDDRGQREADGALLAHLGVVEVRDRRALGGPTGTRDGPGGGEHRLEQRRLARAGRSDQDHVADVGGAGRCRDRPTPWGVRLCHVGAFRRGSAVSQGASLATRTFVLRTRGRRFSLRSASSC